MDKLQSSRSIYIRLEGLVEIYQTVLTRENKYVKRNADKSHLAVDTAIRSAHK